MALLHIFDSSDKRIAQTADRRGELNRVPISNANNFAAELDTVLSSGASFDRVLFETHGHWGGISLGGVGINAGYLQAIKGRYNMLVTTNARIYFNGCNVAEGNQGWSFLEAAAGAFMTSGGGQVFGQTSVGFGNPFNGHVFHLWGKNRTLYVGPDGRIVERFEQ